MTVDIKQVRTTIEYLNSFTDLAIGIAEMSEDGYVLGWDNGLYCAWEHNTVRKSTSPTPVSINKATVFTENEAARVAKEITVTNGHNQKATIRRVSIEKKIRLAEVKGFVASTRERLTAIIGKE